MGGAYCVKADFFQACNFAGFYFIGGYDAEYSVIVVQASAFQLCGLSVNAETVNHICRNCPDSEECPDFIYGSVFGV